MNDDELWELWFWCEFEYSQEQIYLEEIESDIIQLDICISQQFWGEFFSEVR